MNKVLYVVSAVVVSSACWALAPFTIVSPKSGAKVREKVTVTMPKGSIPRGGFIGISIDGKFVEATTADVDEKTGDFIYKLDTKAKKIPDGDRTLGVTLFVNSGGRPTIADTSEVKIRIGNHEGIEVPEDGLMLQYRFTRGFMSHYSVDVGQDESVLSEAQNRRGGRAAQLPAFLEKARMLVAVDDVKPSGLGLVRIQLVPYKSKDYLVLTVPGEDQPRKVSMIDFAPIYRIIRPSGHEVYGDSPIAFPPLNPPSMMDLYVTLPLPLLPQEKVKPGNTWQGNIALGAETLRDTGKQSSHVPAVGTFNGVEWEQGQPCAKLTYRIEVSTGPRGENLTVGGREFRAGQRFAMTQTVWFSLKERRMIRSDIVMEGDVKIDTPDAGGTPAGAGAPAAGGGGRGPRPAGGGGAGGAGVGVILPSGGQQGNGQDSSGVFAQGGGGSPFGGGAGGGQGITGGYFVRQKLYITMTLER